MVADAEEVCNQLMKQKISMEEQIQDMKERLEEEEEEEESTANALSSQKCKVETGLKGPRRDLESLESTHVNEGKTDESN